MKNIVILSLILVAAGCGSAESKVDAVSKATPLSSDTSLHLYLTFDDGPLQGSTHVDSVALNEKIKISVFLVGEHAERNKAALELYRNNPFIDIYNHSYTHANNKYEAFYSQPESVLADIQKNEEALNLHRKIVRLPGRNIWRLGARKRNDEQSGAVAADLLAANGFRVVGWDIEWQHKPDGAPLQTVKEIFIQLTDRFVSGKTFTSNHLVLLLHDEMFGKNWEESELKQLVDTIRGNNRIIFEHIKSYPGID